MVTYRKVLWLILYRIGAFFVHSAERDTYKKTVSQKDCFLFNDSRCINAPRLVYSTFVKNYPGLNGVDEKDYRLVHLNGQW